MTNPYEGTEGSPGSQSGVNTPSSFGTEPQIAPHGSTQSSSGETRDSESEHRTTIPGVAEMSHEAAEQLRHAATEQADHVRERAASARTQAVERIRRVGSALRSVGGELREEDETVAEYAGQAGDRVDQLAEWVESASVQSLVRDTQRFARERPALFFGGAFALGLAAGRFLKSSRSGGSSGSFAEGTEFGRNVP